MTGWPAERRDFLQVQPAPVAAGGLVDFSVAGWGHARGRGGRAGGGGDVISWSRERGSARPVRVIMAPLWGH